MRADVDASKLYLTTVDDFFLPPNCNSHDIGVYEMKLVTNQKFVDNNFLFQVKKRDEKA